MGPAAEGELVIKKGAERVVVPWIDTPEDLMADTGRGLLWSLSEGVSQRYVFASALAPLLP